MATARRNPAESGETHPEGTSKSEVIVRGRGLDEEAGFRRMPFTQPNEATICAMAELEDGRGERFHSTDALLEDLGI